MKLLHSRLFQGTIWLLLLFAVIWLGQQISFVFQPVVVLITTIFLPFLVAGILFYLTDPVVSGLQRLRWPRTAAILAVYVVLGTLLLLAVLWLVPLLERQLTNLATNAPTILRQLDTYIREVQESTFFSKFHRFEFFRKWSEIDYIGVVDSVLESVAANFVGFIGSVANVAVALFTVPILLFYMLRDGHKLPDLVARAVPEDYRKKVIDVFYSIHMTISSYVQGMIVVCFFVGLIVYIGLRVIGLDYALLFAAVAMVTEIIPYFGPVAGAIPALVVGLMVSPWTAVKVLIVFVVAQQAESHLISPLVLGKKLNMHPVTIIVTLLTAGSMAGIVGMILGVPVFAVGKVLITHLIDLVREIRGAEV